MRIIKNLQNFLMDQDYYIDIFNNSSVIYMRKANSKIISWINILLIGSILFLALIFFYKYHIEDIYYSNVVKTEEENYIVLNVDEKFINIKNRNYLQINDEDYKCHLISFSDNYYVFNDKKYWEVRYECDIPEELNLNNNIVKVKINYRKTTLFKEFVTKIRKEVQNARTKN